MFDEIFAERERHAHATAEEILALRAMASRLAENGFVSPSGKECGAEPIKAMLDVRGS